MRPLHVHVRASGCDLRADRPCSRRRGASKAVARKVLDLRLPDFTVKFEGDTWYWEHLGMLSVPSHKEAWERKQKWYERNGYLERVITSANALDGSIDTRLIDEMARAPILQAAD